MSFKTKKAWELTGMHRMFTEEDERLYPIFETTLFGEYFIVDGLQKLDGSEDEYDRISRRFFVSNIVDALNLIEAGITSNIKHQRIVLLQGLSQDQTGDYNCSIIEEIILCEDEAEQPAYIFILKNGSRVVSSLMTTKESELKAIDTIYQSASITEYGSGFLMDFRN